MTYEVKFLRLNQAKEVTSLSNSDLQDDRRKEIPKANPDWTSTGCLDQACRAGLDESDNSEAAL